MAESKNLSLAAMSAGRSESKKNNPLDVPPRITEQGTATCEFVA
ncbi:unannotated protein [freshwater metagenome]|uniref:Unannotated protein n=1 Tax=freshwater metagenome TaxID=449393 RepID=A0A6J6IU17_9ZZZZ